MKIYYEIFSPDHISTFTPGDGWYTFKSVSCMEASLQSEYGDELEMIEFTPELYRSMTDAGDFDGYEPG